MKRIALIITPLMALGLMGAGAAYATPDHNAPMTLAANKVEKKQTTTTTKTHKKSTHKGGGGGTMKHEKQKAQKHKTPAKKPM
ncbi:hypothetical protein D3C86_1184920 [compost metagenome]